MDIPKNKIALITGETGGMGATIAKAHTVSGPKPVPSPTPLVVKKGSKMLPRIPAGMPDPSPAPPAANYMWLAETIVPTLHRRRTETTRH
jgi:hypothetical protein